MALEDLFERKAKEFITEKDEKIIVDWKGLAQLKRKLCLESDGFRSFNPIFHKLLDYLTDKDILTYSTENSWTLTGGGFDLSPKRPAPHSQLYFTRKQDAEIYKNAFYRDMAVGVTIKPSAETV